MSAAGKRRRGAKWHPAEGRSSVGREPFRRPRATTEIPLSRRAQRLLDLLGDKPITGRELSRQGVMTSREFGNDIRTLSRKGLATRAGQGWVRLESGEPVRLRRQS